MPTDRDLAAIASWQAHDQGDDPNDGPRAPAAYCCTVCDFIGRGEQVLRHYRATGHAVRGKRWPASWPNAQFSFPPDVRPYAVFAFEWDFGAGPMRMFRVVGGLSDRSTLTESSVRELGIEVRE